MWLYNPSAKPLKGSMRGIAERFGADTTVPDWRRALVGDSYGSRRVDMV
jgi:hypothetical protein